MTTNDQLLPLATPCKYPSRNSLLLGDAMLVELGGFMSPSKAVGVPWREREPPLLGKWDDESGLTRPEIVEGCWLADRESSWMADVGDGEEALPNSARSASFCAAF
jgi:hypothetical protein